MKTRIQTINEIAKMKTHALAIGAFMTALLPSAEPTAKTPNAMSLVELQSAGWAIVEKTEAQKRLPGVAPYQNLERVIQIVNYRLRRNGAEIRCKTAYDSQRDHYEETCSRASE